MTSPVRKRRDKSRKRLAHAETLEIIRQARTQCDTLIDGDTGAASEPLTRSDCTLIGRAVRGDWQLSGDKRAEIIQRLGQALDSTDERLALSAARVMLAISAATLGDGGQGGGS